MGLLNKKKILRRCPVCKGTGLQEKKIGGIWTLVKCSRCKGRGCIQ